eukprot:CAMPEP_0170550032 /NCGR_PEP_ID=MMETSP0211-20121228/8077_1 /TAXON_ID=311385 /ORGANISM="Pseudokeronopsis sp., Strain OXSARD2" /LENGTH=66 /DNA_ID=CAMNT_0010856299 /DNA_START=419 /DNA_END=619 /DNA_ORIENTATION=-
MMLEVELETGRDSEKLNYGMEVSLITKNSYIYLHTTLDILDYQSFYTGVFESLALRDGEKTVLEQG